MAPESSSTASSAACSRWISRTTSSRVAAWVFDVAQEPRASAHVPGLEDEPQTVRPFGPRAARPVARLREDERRAAPVLDRGGPGAVVVRADHHDLVVGPGQVADDVERRVVEHLRLDGEADADRPGGHLLAEPGAVAFADEHAGDRPVLAS